MWNLSTARHETGIILPTVRHVHLKYQAATSCCVNPESLGWGIKNILCKHAWDRRDSGAGVGFDKDANRGMNEPLKDI